MTQQTAQHTPGPWIVDGYGVMRHDGRLRICLMDKENDRTEANARLIAAAPALLAALEALIAPSHLPTCWSLDDKLTVCSCAAVDRARNQARAAIKAARGDA